MNDTTGTARPAYADDLYCPDCGYSLRGLTSARCPECGLLLDFIESDTPIIPWERRADSDWFRAYWQTVRLVVLRRSVFCRAFYSPVSYAHAQAFRWVSMLHVYIPLLLWLGVVQYVYPNMLPMVADETGWWFVVFVCGCVLLALLALTGIPSYFFQPRYLSVKQQNRAIALSYYGCAPLALAAPMLIALGVLAVLGGAGPLAELAALLGALWLQFILALCWWQWRGIALHALRRVRQRFLVWVVMPLTVVAVGYFGILIGLPLVAYFLALAFYSLRGAGLGG